MYFLDVSVWLRKENQLDISAIPPSLRVSLSVDDDNAMMAVYAGKGCYQRMNVE